MKVSELLENDKLPIFRAIYPICAEAHKDQKRKDGKPYMSHIDAVIEGTYVEYGRLYGSKYAEPIFFWSELDNYLAVAAAHDVLEDCPDKVNIDQLVDIYQNINSESVFLAHDTYKFKSALTYISKKIDGKKTYTDYSQYVGRVKANELSRLGKIADLKHNMSDLSDGNLKEKYQLTLAVLQGLF
jgi:(p)ppGpp synthase/HD superfamily hydrolase